MAVVAGRVVHDKKYFANLFQFGLLHYVYLADAPMKEDRWEMIIETKSGEQLQVETARGEPKTFASLEAARKFAEDIGFDGMEVSW